MPFAIRFESLNNCRSVFITAVQHSTALYLAGFFFFSSRRRHTRLVSDWSSDVCSSDLLAFAQMFYFLAYSATDITGGDNGLLDVPRPALAVAGQTLWPLATPWQYYGFVEIGRASCRERV